MKNRLWRKLLTETILKQAGLRLVVFAANPKPEGTLLHWVCWDNIAYLDHASDQLTLNPA